MTLLEFIYDETVALGIIGLGFAIALGHVEEKTSYGLLIVLGCLVYLKRKNSTEVPLPASPGQAKLGP